VTTLIAAVFMAAAAGATLPAWRDVARDKRACDFDRHWDDVRAVLEP
jgi:hypothetical protein